MSMVEELTQSATHANKILLSVYYYEGHNPLHTWYLVKMLLFEISSSFLHLFMKHFVAFFFYINIKVLSMLRHPFEDQPF